MRRVRLAFAALSSAIVTPAQGPIFSRVHAMLPADLSANLFLHGDVDNDGRVDLVGVANTVTYTSASNSVWRGTPDGMVAVPGALPTFVRNAVSARLADLDGDGDLDGVVLNAPASSTPCSPPYGTGISSDVYWNDGTGQFTHGSAPLPAPGCPNYACLEVGDVDGDGDDDIVAGALPYLCVPNPSNPLQYTLNLGEDHLYLNDGLGGFTLAAGHLPPLADFTTCLLLADFDGDVDLDLFVGTQSLTGQSRSRLYLNSGAGMFTELAGALPLNTSMMQRGAAHARDFDGDGDLDLLLHREHAFAMGNVRYLVNDGTGLFADATATLPPLGPAICLVVGDWNGDLRPDFAVSETEVKTFTNQGTSFAITDSRPLGGELLAWDLEGDGDQDLVAIGGGSRNNIARNDGTGQWHTVPHDLPESANVVLALLDIDADGDLDGLTEYSSPAAPARLLRNEGNGRFSLQPTGNFTSQPLDTDDLLVGDVDGDGDPDVLVVSSVWTTSIGLCRLYRNVAGNLQQAAFPALAASCGALGDLDGDGDLDAYLGRAGQLDQVLLNDGTGLFTPLAGAVGLQTLAEGVALTDVDGDGDLDAAVAGFSLDRILLNAGDGTFAASMFQSTGSSEVQAADVEGDGDQDLIFGGGAQPDRLYRNNGLGSFTLDASALPAPASIAQWIQFADVDADGDADIVRRLSSYTMLNRLQVLINDGSGHFAASTVQDPGAWAFEVGDLDGDSDPDVLVSYQDLRVHWNLQRQLTWRFLPRVGAPLTLDSYGPPAEPYVLAFALAPANFPIPGWGRLRLDPASLLIVQLGAHDAAGRATFVANVPLTPSLTGVSLYWQALSGSVTTLLGNLEVTTLQVH